MLNELALLLHSTFNIEHSTLTTARAPAGKRFLFPGLIFPFFQTLPALCERHFLLPRRQNRLWPRLKSLLEKQNLLLGKQNLHPGKQNLLPGKQNLLPGKQNLLPGKQNRLFGKQNLLLGRLFLFPWMDISLLSEPASALKEAFSPPSKAKLLLAKAQTPPEEAKYPPKEAKTPPKETKTPPEEAFSLSKERDFPLRPRFALVVDEERAGAYRPTPSKMIAQGVGCAISAAGQRPETAARLI